MLQPSRLKKIHAVIPPPDHPRREAGRGYVWGSQRQLYRQPDLINDLPFLRTTDACGVETIGQLIGGPCGVMPHETCGEVLWNTCALTLRDEPLASGVEHGAAQLWMTPAQVSVSLYDLVDVEMREEPP